MELALNEIKVQAKLLMKEINKGHELPSHLIKAMNKFNLPDRNDIKLKHCLTVISQRHGFKSWHHAYTILSGKVDTEIDGDMGTIFHHHRCDALINLWFSTYEEAKAVLGSQQEKAWLLPYKTQFIVVKSEFIELLNIPLNTEALENLPERDFYLGYNSTSWDTLAYLIIRNR